MATFVDEIIVRESGEIVLVEKTTVGNSFAHSRRSINPGDDYSAEVPRVRLVCDLVHNEAYLGVPINPSVNEKWDDFSEALLSDPVLNQKLGEVFLVAPAVAMALPTALDQVERKGIATFKMVFNSFCAYGQVSAAQRGIWADMAVTNNLPEEFVAVVRGELNA